MKRITILIENNHVDLTTLSGSMEIFQWANQYLTSIGRQNAFKIDIVGVDSSIQELSENLNLVSHQLITEIDTPDLIILPSSRAPLSTVGDDQEVLDWLQASYLKGSEIASLCTGVFLLARTGLLDGKKCSTHWFMANEFQARFPTINLTPQEIITDQDGLYTSGGAYSFLNLIIYLIEKYEGRQLAMAVAKMFGIDVDRNSQSQYLIFNGQKNHDDKVILKIQEYIEAHVEEKISVSDLADLAHLDGRSFIRRFKKATYNTPLEYVQRIKVESAKRKLETTNASINEIKYSLAWVDDKSFRRIFKKHTSLSPTAYRQKYQRRKR